jgi:hypothetical protein
MSTPVYTASGTCQTFTAACRYHGSVGTWKYICDARTYERQTHLLSCNKPGFLTEQCWWGVKEIPGKLIYKFPGPQDIVPTIQEDCRGCTLWRTAQIYTKAFFYFQNFNRLHGTYANVISLTPTKMRLACYDFHLNTHNQKSHVEIAWTVKHKFTHARKWRMDFMVPIFKKFKITQQNLWVSPVPTFIPIGWICRKYG